MRRTVKYVITITNIGFDLQPGSFHFHQNQHWLQNTEFGCTRNTMSRIKSYIFLSFAWYRWSEQSPHVDRVLRLCSTSCVQQSSNRSAVLRLF